MEIEKSMHVREKVGGKEKEGEIDKQEGELCERNIERDKWRRKTLYYIKK